MTIGFQDGIDDLITISISPGGAFDIAIRLHSPLMLPVYLAVLLWWADTA